MLTAQWGAAKLGEFKENYKICTDSMNLNRTVNTSLPIVLFPRAFSYFCRILTIVVLGASLISCSTTTGRNTSPVEQPTSTPKEVLPSADPISQANPADVLFAQSALKSLGYKIGIVDGIWGPRSAAAIRQFERDHTLKSADGYLSELNLFTLDKLSNSKRADFATKKAPPKFNSISGKLRSANSSNGAPPLIIVDKPYSVHTKPNPYSSVIREIAAGTGIYVIRKVDSQWFEIELDKGKRGFMIDR